jgi:hypothetical protein
MRRIPAFVLRARRNASYADEQAAGYPERPKKAGGPCVRVMKNGKVCNQMEDDHFAGQCEDWGPYTPKKPAAGTLLP